MPITLPNISTLLMQGDLEGLIEMGAPSDEYDEEAAQIAAAVLSLSHEEITEETIVAIISLVWIKSFELSDEALKLRLPAIRVIAEKILSGETEAWQ